MLDFEITRCSRRCSKTERELKAGEAVFSVLVNAGPQVVRLDYSAEAWPGAPDDAIGWWKTIVQDADSTRVQWAPNDVMLHYFERLEGRDDQQDVRYVLALLLVRRRILRLEESIKDEQGRDVLVLFSPRGERQHRTLEILPSDERIREIQSQLAKLLFDGASELTGPDLPVASPADAASTEVSPPLTHDLQSVEAAPMLPIEPIPTHESTARATP